MNLVAVPGFGFLPSESYDLIEDTFQEYLASSNLSSVNISVDYSDDIKCNTIVIPHWKEIYPNLGQNSSEAVCPPKWDNASCIPPTMAGETAVFPCMAVFNGETYSPHFNATRQCYPNGTWAPTTFYTDCMCNSTEDCTEKSQEEETGALEISIIIYLVGYVLSFLALIGAVTIYLSFREMRCLRHKIHIGLFCAFGLSALNWMFTKSLPELAIHILSIFDQVYCTSWVVTFFFHLTCFYWMFLEGLYLFLQVQFPLSLVSIKYKHFIMFGCGGPIFNMAIWVGLRIFTYNSNNSEDVIKNCPFFEKNEVDFFICEIPIFFILICNTFFLIWIMVIVVSKLRQKTVMDHDKKHWKAAKALIIVMPMLGFGYLITMVGPDKTETPSAYTVFQIVRSVVLSTQGLVISLPYCYLNSEVQNVVLSHYNRWQLIRTVGQGQLSARASFSASTYYSVSKADNMQVYV